MITDNSTCLPQGRTRASAPAPRRDLVDLLTRIYRQAGLSAEAAQRCALADFRCSFPQFLRIEV